jgi:streptomycin 6-kinase
MAADAFEEFLAGVRARHGADAETWCDAAPSLHDELALRWELDLVQILGEDPGTYVVAGTRSGAMPITLEIAYPDAWFTEQVAALIHWGGEGAVSVIDHDPRGALLLERPEPGTSLGEDPDEDHALGAACDVAQRLWIANPGGIAHLAGEVLEWARTMPARHSLANRPFERILIHEAVGAIRELVPTQHEQVLLHGDLRFDTIVQAGEDRWVAVAPRPLIGEQAFDAAGLLVGDAVALAADRGHAPTRLSHRADVISDRLGIDRERLRRWALAIATDYALADLEAGLRDRGIARAQIAEILRTLPPPVEAVEPEPSALGDAEAEAPETPLGPPVEDDEL